MKAATKKPLPAKIQKPVQTNSNKEPEQEQNNTHKINDSAKAASSLTKNSSFNKKIIFGLLILIVLSIVSWGGIYYITIPLISERSYLQRIGTTLNKRILYQNEKIVSLTDSGNANYNEADDGTTSPSTWGIESCNYVISAGNILAITIVEFDNAGTTDPSDDTTDTYTLDNLMLSTGAEHFKYAGGVVTDAGATEIPSYSGMKMHEGLTTNDVIGRTYLVSSIDVTDYDYNIPVGDVGLFGDLSVYHARRFALTFDDAANCTLHQVHDVTAIPTVESNELELFTKESDITLTCTYVVASNTYDPSNPKKLKVTITDVTSFPRTFSTRFSDDFNVMKMNHKSVAGKESIIDERWEYEVSRMTIASAFGVLLDDTYQTPSVAISAWVNPKYWVEINNNSSSIVPIITSYLLF